LPRQQHRASGVLNYVSPRAAAATRLPYETLERIAGKIVKDVPGVVSVTYNITPKPPSTIEAV
jgi:GMP synthase (glutamine-hydrolysing)